MEFLIISIFLFIILIILFFVFQINIKKIKQIGKIEKLDKLTNAFPENKEVAKSILKKLNNETVEITENKDSQASFYFVATNRILIANISNSYTRIQTIAHECLHSIQNKTILWFQYIYSNLCNLYYLILIGLTVFGIVKNQLFQMVILTLVFFIQYVVRSFLEIDAMTKAKYVAKEYMEENNLGTKEERQEIINNYDKLNELGIKTVCYKIFSNQIIKLIIYSIICYIF